MSKIIIPERLAMRLSHDKTWDSCVTQLKENIEPLLAKDPDFFPDYTIHGIDHINRCLDIAEHLIDFDTLSEEPKKTDLLTPRDVAFLVCGIMLHDMGMFLRPDGVCKLVQMDRTDDAFGGKPWKDEWSDYVDRTKRLSQEKMRYHFGKVIPVTEDCVNHTDTDDSKRIIGEFLRQHHARLAHEFAVGVLPGSDDTDLFENTNMPEKARNLIGLLARSHGMAIRDTEAYIIKHFGEGAKPYKTPVFYLMTLLRTADALDADEQRAPKKLEKQQRIPVPISVEEWTWNQCIDPDACDWRKAQKNRYIEANPESSPQYVQLDKWLKGVQADLDLCWSILAEKYSHPKDRYRLSIHRVVSNIHEPGIRETMNEKFLTKEVKITANPEIVKLMMEPLYGDDPTYGVRELLQNAVDACLEREQWEKNHSNSNYKGLVVIRIENGTFTITDNGMGMNEDVLLNYYLSAGASYRSSDAWMAANAPDGKSQVARTGKFGVGFLAAFLLGNEIEVHTQHREDEKGFHFTFNQQSNPLDVERRKRINPYATKVDDSKHVGTTITIKLKENAIWCFNCNSNYPWYNWYAFDKPKIRYILDGTELYHKNLQLHRDHTKNDVWLTLPTDDFALYQWNPNLDSKEQEFYCNGIRIYTNPVLLTKDELNVPFPHVSVIDNNGILDVSLSRNSLKTFPLRHELFQNLFRWHIARLLLTPWDDETHYRRNCATGFTLYNSPSGSIPFFLSKHGFSLNHASVIPLLSFEEYVILFFTETNIRSRMDNAIDFLPQGTPFCIISGNLESDRSPMPMLDLSHPVDSLANFLTGNNRLFSHFAIQYTIHSRCGSSWLHKSLKRFVHEQSHDNLSQTDFILDGEMYTEYRMDNLPEIPIDRNKLHAHDFLAAVHFKANLSGNTFRAYTNSLFTQTLREVLVPEPSYSDKDIWIPFDMEERKKKFPKAFEELAVYMDHIRKHPF